MAIIFHVAYLLKAAPQSEALRLLNTLISVILSFIKEGDYAVFSRAGPIYSLLYIINVLKRI